MNFNKEYQKLINRKNQINNKLEANQQKVEAFNLKIEKENQPLLEEIKTINTKLLKFEKLAQEFDLGE